MNEYRGFKVGDRVEITFSSAHPIKGTITSFGDRKLGGFAEPDTMDVWISETTRYDMIYLVSHDLIKKLPKYAVGDVVRCNSRPPYNYEIASVVGLSDNTIGYTLSDCGSVKFSESMLITFDGFRVGDTVWTVKRGKGKVVSEIYCCTDGRSFFVRFDNDTCDRNPRDRNLIPTEAKYKEALNKAGYAFKIDVAFVQEYVAKPYFGQVQVAPLFSKKPTYTRTAEGHLELVDGMDGCEKKYCASKFGVGENVQYGCIKSDIVMIYWNGSEFLYTLKSNSAPDNIRERFLHETVKPSAKFKVGDAVYFDRKKWDVEDVATNECKIRISASAGSCTREFRAWTVVKESDLRLWVETKLTHCLQTLSNTWYPTSCVSKYEKIIHLGGFRIDGETRDIFACYGKNGKLILWAGIKGDDTTESI